jgi:hypothetical protein
MAGVVHRVDTSHSDTIRFQGALVVLLALCAEADGPALKRARSNDPPPEARSGPVAALAAGLALEECSQWLPAMALVAVEESAR